MACGATLKRTMDFDPLLSPGSSKRRRCAPVSQSSAPRNYLRQEPSPFSQLSVTLTTEQILANIKQEYKRMQKRKHLDGSVQQPETFMCQSPGSLLSGSSVHETSSGAVSPTRKEQPLFTFKQVGMLCERLLKEHEDKVREEYEEIMTSKLAEQYDTFVKFTHDQLMRRFEEQPASCK
ncbi:Akirin-2 [Bagarius yarrelli]|uniref:Akirin-2 n=1 Tax=Bagarius yarrelli TaxID=175774 RepID=A0A556U4X5_BAGYA|nr:Akirin-2 [Bagarius yarrelli]